MVSGHIEGVVALIPAGDSRVLAEDRFLLIRRSARITWPDYWCLPGGAVEQGEDPCAALVREVYEEVGLHVEPRELLWTWRAEDGRLTIHFWLVRPTDGTGVKLNVAEAVEYRWLTCEQAAALPKLFNNARRLFQQIAAVAGLREGQ